jgi:hypothetical protein
MGVDQAKPFSDHLFIVLVVDFAVGFSLLILCYNTYFKYKKPRWFWRHIVGGIEKWKLKKRFNKIYGREREIDYKKQEEKYEKHLVESALEKVGSAEKSEKMMGIYHLYQLAVKKDTILYIYNSLLDILETESDEPSKKIIVEAICRFHDKLY